MTVTRAALSQVRSDCSNLDELPTLYFELDGAEVCDSAMAKGRHVEGVVECWDCAKT